MSKDYEKQQERQKKRNFGRELYSMGKSTDTEILLNDLRKINQFLEEFPPSKEQPISNQAQQIKLQILAEHPDLESRINEKPKTLWGNLMDATVLQNFMSAKANQFASLVNKGSTSISEVLDKISSPDFQNEALNKLSKTSSYFINMPINITHDFQKFRDLMSRTDQEIIFDGEALQKELKAMREGAVKESELKPAASEDDNNNHVVEPHSPTPKTEHDAHDSTVSLTPTTSSAASKPEIKLGTTDFFRPQNDTNLTPLIATEHQEATDLITSASTASNSTNTAISTATSSSAAESTTPGESDDNVVSMQPDSDSYPNSPTNSRGLGSSFLFVTPPTTGDGLGIPKSDSKTAEASEADNDDGFVMV